MSKKWLMLVVTLIVLLMTMPLLAACSDDDDDDEEETKTVQPTGTAQPTETAQPTLKEETLHMGMLTVYVTSPSAKDWSMWLAIDEINERGGMIVGDTRYTWTESVEDDKRLAAAAISGIQKLLYEDNSDYILCQGCQAQVVRPYTEEEKVIHFAWTTPEIWTGPEWKYTFTCQTDGTLSIPMLLDWVSQNRPDIKTAAYITSAGAVNEAAGDIFKEMSPANYGIEITDAVFHDYETRDFYPVLTSILSGDHPDAIIVNNNQPNTLASARDLGFEGTFIVPQDIPDFWYHMMQPEQMDGIISLSMNVDSPKIPQWYKDYKAAYIEFRDGTIPYNYSTCGSYLMVYIVSAAIEAAQSVDPDVVTEALETQPLTLEFPGGETLDVKFYGEEYFGVNHTWQPPRWVSVHNGEIPEIMEEITGEEISEYRALVESYR